MEDLQVSAVSGIPDEAFAKEATANLFRGLQLIEPEGHHIGAGVDEIFRQRDATIILALEVPYVRMQAWTGVDRVDLVVDID